MTLIESGFIPLVVGLVQVAKITGLSTRFAPLLSVALGLFFGVIAGLGIVEGLVVGLAGAGLWSGAKATSGY